MRHSNNKVKLYVNMSNFDKGSALEVRPIFGLHLFVSAYLFMKDFSLDLPIFSVKSAGSLHFLDEFDIKKIKRNWKS